MDKITEMFEAVKAGDLAKVKTLVEADPVLAAAKNPGGFSPVIYAYYFGHPEIANFLATKRPSLDIFEAATMGKADSVMAALTADRKVANEVAPDGFTPLHLAAYFGHPDIAVLLLSKGADVNAVSKNPMALTALHSAAAHSRPEQRLALARILISKGANVDAKQQGGFTALHAAAQSGDHELAKLLAESGADIHAKTDDGKTALAFAQEKDKKPMIEYLKSLGAAD